MLINTFNFKIEDVWLWGGQAVMQYKYMYKDFQGRKTVLPYKYEKT